MSRGYHDRILYMNLCPWFAKCRGAKGMLMLITARQGIEVWEARESQVWPQIILILDIPERLIGSFFAYVG